MSPRRTGSRTSGGASDASLERYDAKRDFTRTPEPGPKIPAHGEGPLTFVVQKHAARQLHYDFRLELDGVLKSWSVPRAPALSPKEKRLAVMVEDHPLEYGTFEGVIPKGDYGAGQVIVWDNGTYSPDEGGYAFADREVAEARLRQELADGKVSITLRGRKLKGSWALVKMQRGENEWLLIKHRDGREDDETDITEEDRSVISGFTIDDLKAGRLPDRANARHIVAPAGLPGAKRAAFPTSVTPMLATLTEKPFSDPVWLFEPKLDGARAVALLRDGNVTLLSRSGINSTKQYPGLAAELTKQAANEVVFDGEIVALDYNGRPSFELLQQRLNLQREPDIQRAEASVPVLYYVFDMLHLEGYDLRGVRLEQRREQLERVLFPTDSIRLLEDFAGEGEAAFAAVAEHGLEGVVAKRRDSAYETGRRSRAWLKIKATLSDEFVVVGYTEGQGARKATFGALLLGQHDDEGRLVYAGTAGSGFDDRMLRDVRERLDAMAQMGPPFAEEPPIKGIASWVRPELVVEVKFAERTREGYLRAPVFMRLRPDKAAQDVRLVETAAAPVAEHDEQDAPFGVQEQIEAALEQLQEKKDKLTLLVAGSKIPVTNLDKPLWPKSARRRALTKRDLLVYFARVAPYLLPHLRNRPLTLTRYPNGITGKHFYQKHWDAPLPNFVDTVLLFSSSNEGDGEYLTCNNLPTLLWLGQLADLELHTWYSRVSPEPDGDHLSTKFSGSLENIESSLLDYPDFIVFDLDPYIYSGREGKGDEPELNRKAFEATCEVARWLKDALDSLSLSSFVKTSGRTGLHIYVPILRQLDYSEARAACETIGHFLLRQHPSKITMDWSVDKRAGKIFVDHNQNVRGKTLASVYSPRPLAGGPVSMPLRWEELEVIYPSDFTILTAPDRLAATGDLWADILDAKHDVRALLGQVEDATGH